MAEDALNWGDLLSFSLSTAVPMRSQRHAFPIGALVEAVWYSGTVERAPDLQWSQLTVSFDGTWTLPRSSVDEREWAHVSFQEATDGR